MKMKDFIVKTVVLVLVMSLNRMFPVYAWAKEESVNFERVDSAQGLSSSTIYCIFQDREGFLWLGTNQGLHKYDGYGFKTYYHQPMGFNGPGGSSVMAIIQDRPGIFWLGTFGGGLEKFDPGTETFTHYKNEPGNPNSLGDNFVFSLGEDRRGMLWIGTQEGGLNKFSPGTGTFTRFRMDPGDPNSLNDNYVRIIFEDQSGTLWIGTKNGGLNKLSPETGTFTHYRATPGGLSNNWILSITESPKGTLWIGTYGGGLDKFDPATGIFTHFRADPGNPNRLSNDEVRTIYPDKTDILWIGTSMGLNCFDPQKVQFTRYQADPANPVINLKIIRSILEDRSGVLWIGTEGEGLLKIDRKKKNIRHYQHISNNSHSLSDNRVTAIYEDHAGTFWIGTDTGLNKWNRENNTFSHYRYDANKSTGLRNDRVWTIYEDRRGEFWIGTLGGLDRFNRDTGAWDHWESKPGNPHSLTDNGILSIGEDYRGFLWVGTTNGLNRWDRGTKTFKCYRKDPGNPNGLSNDMVLTIFEDRSRVLWIGTVEGLYKFDGEKETFTRYLADPQDPVGLSSSEIDSIYEDRAGILWVGTYGGLNKYDRGKNTFTHYHLDREPPGDMIKGILEDDKGHLWISTNKGIFDFDPGTGNSKNYDPGDGLQGGEFSNAHWKSKNGEMFFGGYNGFNAFFPDQITEDPYPPSVVITDLKISNKSVPIGEELDGRVILERPISETAEITLSYKQNTLSFEYVGLHYAAPGSNKYAYKMEGLEKNWNYVGSRRYAIYPYLKPGNYEFKVKASNNDNIWNETGASIRIRIPPPFWWLWWFRVLVGVAIISMVFGGYAYRTQRLRKKLAEQEQVQILLKQSRDEMEKSRDIAELRSAENEKIIAAISSLFITVDAQGKIFQWNGAAEKFFKIPKTNAAEQRFDDVLMPFIPGDKAAEILDKGLLQAQASNNIEIPVTFKKENESKLLMAQINPIIDKNGKNMGFLLLAEDITHQKREQMRLLVSQKLEVLGQMAAGIAHEIRSPLQYIGDNVQFLLETFGHLVEFCREIRTSLKEAPQTGEHHTLEKLNQYLENSDFDYFMKEIPTSLDHMVNGVTRVSNIVKSMSTFSYMGDEVDERADINELLESTLVVAYNRLKKVADLQTDYTPGLPPISCGRGDLNQVFLNLLINAADAVAETGKRGLIKISTKQQDNELIIEIFDNGVGIPEEIKNQMFTPFFTTKKLGHGTGQGLALSYSIIVGKYNGKLYFESKVREGTTFFIHLPIGTMGE